MDKENLKQQLEEAIHRYDLLVRPYCMFVHPTNKELCEQVLKQIGQYDDYIIRETIAMDKDKIVIMNRKDLESYENFGFNINFQLFENDN